MNQALYAHMNNKRKKEKKKEKKKRNNHVNQEDFRTPILSYLKNNAGK
jgi:hypothetical protein